MVKQVRIISLGEVVTPNIMEAIKAFIALVYKYHDGRVDLNEIQKKIGGIFQQPGIMALLNDFKLGKVDESEFTKQMIAALREHAGAELSEEEFNHAWNTMNPSFEKFSDLLNQAIEYNKQPNKKLVFISFTNPKDMRHLILELDKNSVDYELDENKNLIKVGGIELYTTYASRMTKSEIITGVIKKLNTNTASQSYLGNSISQILGGEKEDSEPIHIKYVRGANEIKNSPLKKDLDETNQEVEKKAEDFFVDTMIWDKSQPLLEVLNNDEMITEQIAVCKL